MRRPPTINRCNPGKVRRAPRLDKRAACHYVYLMGISEHPAIRVENVGGPSQPGGQAHRPSRFWRATVPLVVLAVTAVGLRLAAARGDLVLDEIWSWLIASQAESAWQIFVMPVDNNHILNTLVLYALGPKAPLWAYRLPAVLAGSLALWFAYRLARRQGRVAPISILTLLGFSHVLILFGTEARGYGYVACCTLAAWWAIEKYLDRPQLRYARAFGLASSLGFLSHLTFMFAYLALGVYSAMKMRLRRGGWRRLVVLNRLPVLTCILLLFTYVLGMAIGGGTQSPLFDTLLATLSLMAGGPERGVAAYVAAFVMAALLAISLAAECRLDRARGVMYLTAIFVWPAVVLAVTGHAFVYPRYFLVPMIFGYVAVGSLFARWFQAGRFGRSAVSLLLVGYVACNLVPVVSLIGQGRGQYSTAVRWMAEHTAGPAVTVASDHDFRNWLVAGFYADRDSQAYSESGKTLVYVNQTEYPGQGTEWFLRHSFSGESAPPDSLTDPFGNKYELVQVFPSGSISGWTWWLYRHTRV